MTLVLPVPNAHPYPSVWTSFPSPKLELPSHYCASCFISSVLCCFSPKLPPTYGLCICSWFLWLHHDVYLHTPENLELGTNNKRRTCGICLSVSGYLIQYNIF